MHVLTAEDGSGEHGALPMISAGHVSAGHVGDIAGSDSDIAGSEIAGQDGTGRPGPELMIDSSEKPPALQTKWLRWPSSSRPAGLRTGGPSAGRTDQVAVGGA
jgi:hypothetical protein